MHLVQLYFLSPLLPSHRQPQGPVTVSSTPLLNEKQKDCAAAEEKMSKHELFELGNKCFSHKDYETAELYYLKALVQDPNNVVLLGNLSAARAKQNKFDSAIETAEQAILLKPTWAKGRFRLAQGLHGLKKERDALKAAYQACVLDEKEKSYVEYFNALREVVPHEDVAALVRAAVAELRDIRRSAVQAPVVAGEMMKKIPVTVLSGFLGSGKTTLLKRILTNQKGMRVAVLVNDMSDVNIDAQLLEHATIHSIDGKPSLVELSNGCICCTLRDDLLREVMKIAITGQFDYLVIESTGISEPMPVAMTFSMEDVPTGLMLPTVARLDTMVTVVDLSQFEFLTSTSKRLKDVGMETTAQDQRTLADLLVDQIEFADVIILNKTDLVQDSTRLARIESTVVALNPQAKVYKTNHCEDIPLAAVLNTSMFNMERASKAAGWKQELLFPHLPETLEYGISSFTFRTKRPFDAKRISHLLFRSTEDPENILKRFGVLRSKGFFWVVQDDRIVLEWGSAGPNYSCKTAGFWNAAVDNDTGAKPNDRKVELVFIGIELKRDELTRALNGCLVDDDTPSKRDPTVEGLGEELFNKAGFGYLYELMGTERRFDQKTLKKEQTRLDQLRARLELLSNLERDLTPSEIIEAKQLAAEYKALRG